MAQASQILSILCLTLLLATVTQGVEVRNSYNWRRFFLRFHLHQGNTPQHQKSWCVARNGTKETSLLNNIQFSCSVIDCDIIEEGGPCFSVNSNQTRASAVMNLFYQTEGSHYWDCYFDGSGIIVHEDPSVGTCKFAWENASIHPEK